MVFAIATDSDVISIREHCREFSMLLGFNEIEQTSIVTAATEIITAMSENAHKGVISLVPREEKDRVGLSILIERINPDIHEFIKMLQFQSDSGEAVKEIVKTKWLMDDFSITMEEDKGTMITLTKWQNR